MAQAAESFRPLLIALSALLAVSVAGQMVGAANGSAELSYFAAGAFAAGVLRAGWQVNRPWWTVKPVEDIGPVPSGILPKLAVRNATLLAMGYIWGAASLLGVYHGTTLKWQHGWQYAAAMALIGLAIFAVSRTFEKSWSLALLNRLSWATILQSWAASGAVFWLAGTAKLLSKRSDWAANVVFLVGAIIIAGVGAMWLRSARLIRARSQQALDAPAAE